MLVNYDKEDLRGLGNKCSECGSTGFAKSVLGEGRCEFCDGTFSGNPPTEADIEDEKKRREVEKTR